MLLQDWFHQQGQLENGIVMHRGMPGHQTHGQLTWDMAGQ
jgi:hypothetical protein